jgi:hypothetical protein
MHPKKYKNAPKKYKNLPKKVQKCTHNFISNTLVIMATIFFSQTESYLVIKCKSALFH